MTKLLHMAPRIGMGCWAIGGPFWSGDVPVGYSGADDAESLRTVHAAWDAGIRVFDTSAVYGAGNSETLLGKALADRSNAIIVSKFGHSFDAQTKQMTGPRVEPDYIRGSVDESRLRLGRDQIDVMLLHLNGLSVSDAHSVFDTLDALVDQGAIGAYGWSTDFPQSVEAFAWRPYFTAVQHSMNVFFDAPSMGATAQAHGLVQLNRSPLGMGVLTGKFSDGRTVGSDDVRSNDPSWQGYFDNGHASKHLLEKLDALRDLLTVGGRTLGQGALCWLLANSDRTLPIPGAKTAAQAIENAGALHYGPLPPDVMAEIETVLQRAPEGPPRAR